MTESKPKTRRPPQFDLIAGNAALDFVNTLDDRYTEQPKELLRNYSDLARFGEDTKLLEPKHIDRLLKLSSSAPARARDALQRAIELRETIHDIFFAITNQRPTPAEALAKLNREVQIATQHLHLTPSSDGDHFEWHFGDLTDFDGVRWRIARSAADLLSSDQLPFVRACSSGTCLWLFLDTSKNHNRRWCDMKRCGNRDKVRRFYARNRSSN